MKGSVTFTFVVLLGGLNVLLQGQDADTSYPGGPALKRAPDFSCWTVTCHATPPSGAASTSADLTNLPFATMTITKTNDVRSVESTDAAGQKTIRWFFGGLESYTATGLGFARYISGPDRQAPGTYIDFSQTDFPECAWIKPDLYIGIETVGAHKCLIFGEKQSSPNQSSSSGNSSSSDGYINHADIDLETRIPVKSQVGNLTYTYQFLAPPTSMLNLPPLMQARLKFEQKRNTDLNKRPAAD